MSQKETKKEKPISVNKKPESKASKEYKKCAENSKYESLIDRISWFILLLKADFESVALHDPALRNSWETFLLYNGFWAIVAHRFLHVLWLNGFKVISRLCGMVVKNASHILKEKMQIITGVEIHPGARLGAGVFIDHGTGVVIGETAILGENCLIYQSVTLGGSGKYKGKRHPTLGNGVIVGCNASILGPITLGDHVRVGAGSVVTRDVPPDCTVVGIPGRFIRRKRLKDEVEDSLDHGSLADPNADAFKALYARELLIESSLKRFQETLMETKKELFKPIEPTESNVVSDKGSVARKSLEKMVSSADSIWHPRSPISSNYCSEDYSDWSAESMPSKKGVRRDSIVAKVVNLCGLSSLSKSKNSDEMDRVTQEILSEYLQGGSLELLVDGAGI